MLIDFLSDDGDVIEWILKVASMISVFNFSRIITHKVINKIIDKI